MSDADLNLAMDQPVEFPAYPCHTQSVERAVKLVTDAASQVEMDISSLYWQAESPGKILQLRGNTSTRLSKF